MRNVALRPCQLHDNIRALLQAAWILSQHRLLLLSSKLPQAEASEALEQLQSRWASAGLEALVQQAVSRQAKATGAGESMLAMRVLRMGEGLGLMSICGQTASMNIALIVFS